MYQMDACRPWTFRQTKTCHAVSGRVCFPVWRSFTGLLVHNCAVCNLHQQSGQTSHQATLKPSGCCPCVRRLLKVWLQLSSMRSYPEFPSCLPFWWTKENLWERLWSAFTRGWVLPTCAPLLTILRRMQRVSVSISRLITWSPNLWWQTRDMARPSRYSHTGI